MPRSTPKRRIVTERYQSGAFCQAIDCSLFQDIEIIENPKKRSELKERLCEDCMARKFHHYLETKRFALVKSKIVPYEYQER